MVMFKRELASNDKIRVNNRGCSLYMVGRFIYILVQSYFELVSSAIALEATEPVSEPVTQMAVELINNHLISVQQKR